MEEASKMKVSHYQTAGLDFLMEELAIVLPAGYEEIILEKQSSRRESRFFEIRREATGAIILRYSHEALIYRGLFVGYPRLLASEEATYREETPILEVSYSLDASRNGVMQVANAKKFIAYLAVMGYTTLYLYTEDTYEVANLPYFGYLRGAYSAEEIKEIVAFAALFGMEVVPAIQTLAHLTQFLKWFPNQELQDDGNTLLIGEEKVYEAIEKMLASCQQLYQTKRIHLGMDEAYQAGLGRYLSLHGYQDRTTLMIQHMQRVLALVAKYDLEPLIWSDFIYKLLDETQVDRYYNPAFQLKAEAAATLPAGLTYVHWDYGSDTAEAYETVIDHHLAFCDLDHYVLATGAHMWNSLAPNHGKTERIIAAAVAACHRKGVKEVMLTTWGDDGQETEHWHSLLGGAYLAECVYNPEKRAEETTMAVAGVCDTLLGEGSYRWLSALRYFDEVDTVTPDNLNMTNISKLLLWQDPLVGLYDFHVAAHNKQADRTLGQYYQQLATDLATEGDQAPKDPTIALIRERYRQLAEVLAGKAELGVHLQEARKKKNPGELQKLRGLCLTLATQVEELAESHEAIWMATYKSYGWEVLEQRYAGVAHRLRRVARRITNYLAGTDELLELVEERLPFMATSIPIEISGFTYRQTSVSGYC